MMISIFKPGTSPSLPPSLPPSVLRAQGAKAADLMSVLISAQATDIFHLQSFQNSQEVWVEGIRLITKFDTLARSPHLPRVTQK